MNDQFFIKHMAMLEAYCGKILEPGIKNIYWNRLKNLTDDEFERACSKIYETFKPTSSCQFPMIANFLDCCGYNAEDKARNAIALVKQAIGRVGPYQSVDFNDPALHAAIRGFGGWVAMCNWSDEDWNINEGRFAASYKAARSSGLEGPEYLPGISDTHNSAIGKSSKCDFPVCIEYVDGKFNKQISSKTYKMLDIEAKSDSVKLIDDISNKFNMLV